MGLDKIKENHERFKSTQSVIDKLRIAAQNTVIQFKAATKAMEEIKYMANSLGYKMDEDTGDLNAL